VDLIRALLITRLDLLIVIIPPNQMDLATWLESCAELTDKKLQKGEILFTTEAQPFTVIVPPHSSRGVRG
jgi:hypothetical protein